MGNPKQKWKQEEEDALRKGVAKHGTGKWKDIQRDPEFHMFLFSRSNIDLKDKWRNLIGGGSGQGQRDKSRAKTKTVADATPSLPNQPAIPDASVVDEVTGEATVDGSAKLVDETKSGPKYDDMISEALSNLNEPNGSEVGAIFSYIELQKSHEVSQNFKKQVRARLKRLVVGGKVEENQNRYKRKEDAPLVAKTPAKIPATREQDTRPRLPQSAGGAIFRETLDEAAIACAYRIAEAENKSFVAAEAVKEAERVAKMAEDADSIYQFTREMLERCAGDEITLVA